MGFSRPEYWSVKPFPFPGDLLNPGIEPALEGGFFTTGPPGKSPYSSLMRAQPVKTVGSVYSPPTSSPSLRSILLPRPPGTCTWLAMFGDRELQFSLDPEQTHLSLEEYLALCLLQVDKEHPAVSALQGKAKAMSPEERESGSRKPPGSRKDAYSY